MKSTLLDFFDQTNPLDAPTLPVAELVRGLRGQKLRRRGVSKDDITFLKSPWKTVRNINHPAKSDEIFLKVGTPNGQMGNFDPTHVVHRVSYWFANM